MQVAFFPDFHFRCMGLFLQKIRFEKATETILSVEFLTCLFLAFLVVFFSQQKYLLSVIQNDRKLKIQEIYFLFS